MARRLFPCAFLVFLLFYPVPQGGPVALVSPSLALEKVKLGSTSGTGAASFLPVLTAEQRGFWKENGLEVEWIPFPGAAPQMRAVAAGVLSIGLLQSDAVMTAAERGLPVVMVAEYISEYPFYLWVRTDSPYRHPRDLKGAKIAVTTLAGTTHAYARVITKAHGIEKDVRFVGVGGVGPAIAGLKVGAFEANVNPLISFVRLKLEGLVRQIGSTADYLPKPWVQYIIFARKDFARGKPEVVRKAIRATLQAADFIQKNPRWAVNLIKSHVGASEEVAQLVSKEPRFNLTGKIERQGVANVRSFLVEYGILTEKGPAVDELFSNEYLPS